jgi:hypothetical protein
VSGNVWPELITVGTEMRPMVSGIGLSQKKKELYERLGKRLERFVRVGDYALM